VVQAQHGGLAERQQAFLVGAHGDAVGGVQVQHRARFLAGHVHRAVDGEAGRVDPVGGAGIDDLTLGIHLDQRRRSDLVEQPAVGVDQEMMLRPGHARGQVGEHQIFPAVQGHQPVGGGQVLAHFPLGLAHLALASRGSFGHCGTSFVVK
jgi:hypothetical protein